MKNFLDTVMFIFSTIGVFIFIVFLDDEYNEDEVRVIGTGNINFETRQTGL